jgi:hypothetical protein
MPLFLDEFSKVLCYQADISQGEKRGEARAHAQNPAPRKGMSDALASYLDYLDGALGYVIPVRRFETTTCSNKSLPDSQSNVAACVHEFFILHLS